MILLLSQQRDGIYKTYDFGFNSQIYITLTIYTELS